MAIYPDRTRGGQLTGKYRVEVQKGTTRLRGRADTLAEAKAVEADLKQRLLTGAPAPERVSVPAEAKALTLREAVRKSSGILWSRQATEAESFRKLERVLSLVGETLPVNEFTQNKVDGLVLTLRETGVSDATVNRYLSCVSAFLRFCRKRGLMTVEAPEIEWATEDEGRIRWLSYEEEEQLMSFLPPLYATVVFVALRTGLRASELLNLTSDQVEERWVHLWGDGTKGGKSRSVPLTPEVHAAIVELLDHGMPDYWQLRTEWDKARKAMGLLDDPTFVFHACRHSYATRAVQAGVNIRVLQKLMGHSAIQTTLRYAHVDDQTLAEEALKAVSFHDNRSGGMRGGMRPKMPATLHRGERRNRRNARSRKTECPRTGTANPFTPVRFRLGPPFPRLRTSDSVR
jgi:integrase